MAGDKPAGPARDVYFERRVIGSTMKVSALDSVTGIEVSVIGPAGAAATALEQLALAKLKARLERGG